MLFHTAKYVFRALVAASFLLISCSRVEPETPGKDGPQEKPEDPKPAPEVNHSTSAREMIALTPESVFEQSSEKVNSHSGWIGYSRFTPVYGTYATLGRDVMFWDVPLYPRIARCSDGSWIMTYHYGDGGAQAGNQVMYLKSADLVNWVPGRGDGNSVPYLLQGGGGSPLFAGAYVVRLSDGRLMAAASYRKNDTVSGDYHTAHAENGIVIKFSSDNGVTWTANKLVNVGTNWEPCIVELPSGTIQIYYTDCNHVVTGLWKGPAAYGGSGVGMIYSEDKGATWIPGNQQHIHTMRQCLDVKNGQYLYTDQMPAVVVLNDGKSLAAAMESDMGLVAGRSDYSISLAYSDNLGSWGEPNEKGEVPLDRVNASFKGCAPYLVTFPSGETVLSYNTSYFCMRIGDETARNFGEEQLVFKANSSSRGYWGSMFRVSPHRMVAAIGGADNVMQIGQFYLNHALESSQSAVSVDGRNDDWNGVTEALMLCSKGPVKASLRAGHDRDSLYFLVEIPDMNLSYNDYFQIFLTSSDDETISSNTLRIRGAVDGLVETSFFNGSWKKTPCSAHFASLYEGTINDGADEDRGYVAEISIPRKLFDLSSGFLLANFSLRDQDNSTTSDDSLAPVSEISTKNWIPIFGF